LKEPSIKKDIVDILQTVDLHTSAGDPYEKWYVAKIASLQLHMDASKDRRRPKEKWMDIIRGDWSDTSQVSQLSL